MLREDWGADSAADLPAAFGTGVAPSVPLPAGELLTDQSPGKGDPAPLCWISDERPSPHLLAALRTDHERTGLWPLLLCDSNEVYGDRCTVGIVPPEPREHIERWHAADVMARIWDGLVQAEDDLGPAYELEVLEPFGYDCPGLAAEGNLLADPDILANQQVPRFVDADTRLGLVPVERGADVLATLGWSGAANHVSRTAGLAAMARSWEERFGVRLLRLGPDRLDLSVAAPPQEMHHAAAVAAEHWTFCPDRILQESGSISAYAREIRGRRTWSFWWD
ncbi:uncharacterized protein DUF4253 [Saccharopolyspora erythraea NRRL 2338]|uniref:DUF4253 domain-containing protein n=1 Tax=Saccharopolyspora erythraea TaxID=1836 RepID=A0ABP3P321_SACER|nr:DUF4253 domain-containing protein [Saccharopolyspora erythraea]EQD83455.1 hypothetical protein N599_25200 [Saccharopolyspora erythraea D]PFG99449.1 uncharacterized protein DUF4253 [Saccharopolyspora erythraea NRRL 2338]QRK89358.1 DUF4253 domain-containing protein [Saccharopolyspora erythraea]